MFTADNTGLGPATGNVRAGVSYGGMTGSLAVPLPSQVAVGVATDDTVGTAALTADNLRAALGLGSANLDSQLAVLSNLDATVSSRLASSAYTAPSNSDVAAIKAKTDLLETTRLAQCSTVATTGDQIAAAFNSP
jgi:hypothetical protein